jgi:hypothetical protein
LHYPISTFRNRINRTRFEAKGFFTMPTSVRDASFFSGAFVHRNHPPAIDADRNLVSLFARDDAAVASNASFFIA